MSSILVTLLVSCGASSHRVEYRIGGSSGSVNITMTNAKGGMEQGNIKPPYSLAFDLPAGQPVYLSGQNQWDAGIVTCDVLIDGQNASSATSTLPYGVVSCGGHT